MKYRQGVVASTLPLTAVLLILVCDACGIATEDDVACVPASHGSPVIFYVPHQDDEAIGMAHAVAQEVAAGNHVVMVLLTNGINGSLLDMMNGAIPCGGHGRHDFHMTMEEMMSLRRAEFIASSQAMGVRDIRITNDGQGWDEREPWTDYPAFVARLRDLMLQLERELPGASHRCAMGSPDFPSPDRENPTHTACSDAIKELQARDPASDWGARFYRVYAFLERASARSAAHVCDMAAFHAEKQAALDVYNLYDPDTGHYALGAHSASVLINAAYEDTRMFVDLVP